MLLVETAVIVRLSGAWLQSTHIYLHIAMKSVYMVYSAPFQMHLLAWKETVDDIWEFVILVRLYSVNSKAKSAKFA